MKSIYHEDPLYVIFTINLLFLDVSVVGQKCDTLQRNTLIYHRITNLWKICVCAAPCRRLLPSYNTAIARCTGGKNCTQFYKQLAGLMPLGTSSRKSRRGNRNSTPSGCTILTHTHTHTHTHKKTKERAVHISAGHSATVLISASYIVRPSVISVNSSSLEDRMGLRSRRRIIVDKKNQLDVTFVFFISLLIVVQHVSGNHVPIIRS